MNTRYITLGTFVTVTLGAFAWLAMQLGFSPRDGTHYTVRMPDAQGLVEGNAVRIAGVEIGKIDEIHVEGNEAVVRIHIKKGNTLFDHVCASSLMKGMLGEKFLGLDQQRTGTPLEPDAEIGCVKPTVDVGTALNSTAGMIYGDTELLAPIARLVTKLDGLTAEFDAEDIPREKLAKLLDDTVAVMSTTRAMLEENRADVREIVTTTRKLVQNPKIPRMIDDGEKILSELRAKVPGLLDTGDRTLGKLDKLAGVLDDTRFAKLDKMLSDGSIAVGNLRTISEDFKAIGKKTMPLLKNLGTLAERAAGITESHIRQLLQVEGFRVRIGQSREAREFMKKAANDD